MKKNLLLACFCMLLTNSICAQTYSFTKLSGTYADLTGATVISSPGWDDFTIVDTKLPFPLVFFGHPNDSLYIMAGFVAFYLDGPSTFYSDQIDFFDTGFTERGTGGASNISTVTVGSAPNRIYKLQTKNAALSDDAVTDQDYGNAQLWFYEGTNVIEIHFGASSIKAATYSPLLGPTVGLFVDNTTFVSMSGPANNPTPSSSAASLYVTGTPTNGAIYRFTPTVTGLREQDVQNTGGSVFPNPSNGMVYFKTASNISEASIRVTNLVGQIVYERNNVNLLNGQKINLDTQLSAGMYNVQLITKDQSFTPTKLIIK
jgi:hypothetical protein